jgi:integrase
MSKANKDRHVFLTPEGVAFFRNLTAGRKGTDLLLGREWKKANQSDPMRAACKRAKIEPAVGFHQLRHTYASLAIMNGAELFVVAKALGHGDTRMVEKHYGHLAPSYVANSMRKHAPRFNVRAP